ncbi:MAG: hypothetical protein RLZZ347_262 [Candidatus Parcubacteria bacterium]|jgi:hypothetical protein
MAKNPTNNFMYLLRFFVGVLVLVPVFAHASVKTNVSTPPVSNRGLVGYWSFNGTDVNSTTVFDRSTYAYDGTLHGMGTKYSLSGKVGQAFSFDGTGAYISLPNLDMQAPLSWSFWIKRGRIGHANDDFFGGDSAGSWGLGFNADNTLFLTKVGVNSVSSTGTITDMKWHHVAVTYDGTNVRFYFDGVLDSAPSYTSGTYTSSGGAYAMGRVNVSAYFSGALDEVRMYSRVLSASEVRTLYGSGSVKIASPSSSNAVVPNGLIGLWSFNTNDVVNGTLIDRSVSGNTAYLYNTATSTVYSTGRIGQGLTFDGADDYAKTLATTWGVTNTLSMSAWIKTTSNTLSIASLGHTTVTDEALMYVYGGTAALYFSQGTGVYTGVNGTKIVNDGVWHHVVVVATGPSVACANIRIYVDGVRDTEHCIAESVSSISDATPRNFFIGWRSWGGGGFELYNGSIDDVRLYNRVLTLGEIGQLYRSSGVTNLNVSQNKKSIGGLVGLWSFDGSDMVTGTTAYDRSGNGYNGALHGLATSSVAVGKVGQALRFNGVDNYISVPNFDMSTLSAFGWVNITPGSTQAIIDSLANGGWGLYIASDDTVRFTKRGSAEVVSVGTVSRGWHYIGVTYDGANARLYIDGVLDSAPAFSQTFSNGAMGYGIGGLSSAGFTINGRLDDVRLYNRVLSSTEVRTLYNTEK